jgi:hypothetical protein
MTIPSDRRGDGVFDCQARSPSEFADCLVLFKRSDAVYAGPLCLSLRCQDPASPIRREQIGQLRDSYLELELGTKFQAPDHRGLSSESLRANVR